MRFHESLGYLNNNNNNNNCNGNSSNHASHYNGNSNLSNNFNAAHTENTCGNSTVKTFTTNGNYQVKLTNYSYQGAYSTGEIDDYNRADHTDQGFEAVSNNPFCQTTTKTNYFYGLQRRLKSRENVNEFEGVDGNLNGNKIRANVDCIDDSLDIEAEINHLISRSNLCRQNFERCSTDDDKQTTDNCGNQFMDEEEEFFAHSKLVSETTITTDHLNYPRGIINPNYPGFQHLAHTLSDHFIFDHHQNQGNMSDSDFSEFESDVTGDSAAQSSDELMNNNIILNHNNPFYDDTNGNNIIEEEYQTATDIHFKKVEEILRTVFETNSVHLMAAIDLFSKKESLTVFDDDDGLDFEKENDKCLPPLTDCDLKTYLKYYDNAAAIDIFKLETILQRQDDPPPDVIQKSNSSDCGFETSAEKPDILLDVNGDRGQIVVNTSNMEKDEPGSNWSITPVDIVGNFEQEVEREFGLLVDGYKSNSNSNSVGSEDEGFADITDYSEDLQSSTEKLFEKVSDALLSNANETITTVDAHTFERENNETVTNESEIDERTPKRQIPTAIVKPKYQKSSFDERQLPVVAYLNQDTQAWYDKQIAESTTKQQLSGTTETTAIPKTIHLPELDGKAKKRAKKYVHIVHESARNNRITISSERYDDEQTISSAVDGKQSNCNAVTVCKGKNSSASVAVVQPRKKERMDEKLMKTIVQMQIKKNSQLYPGSHFNSNNNNYGKVKVNTINGNKNLNNNNCNNNGVRVDERNANNKSLQQSVEKEQKYGSGCFDVYNIETALPAIDLETIEDHLKLVKEEERRRKRNDREEIRRRLAMGAEDDYLTKISQAKPTRKSSLHARLQEGMNLQICYVNDAAAVVEGDSPSSDSESCPKLSKPTSYNQQQNRHHVPTPQPNPYSSRPLSMKKSSLHEKTRSVLSEVQTDEDPKETDFFTKQARLQIEARMALAQAKDIAHMQMEMERQKQKASPITNMIRNTVEKVGLQMSEKRRVSRQMLTDMNVAQLQIIVNDFHSQIESLNEQLVKYLMERDDLHMGQDSMLVDIEDLTRYLGAKKDPYYERKKSTKKFHSMKSPKYLVTHKYQHQPQHKQQQLASQIGKS